MSEGILDASTRTTLARVADLLIPLSGVMVSASEADVQGDGIDRVIEVRPDLLASVLGLLAELGDVIPASFDELYAMRSTHFGGFAEAVTAAYFLNPAVARAVGYTKRSMIPIVFDADLATLVSTVCSRGPIYRPTPRENR
jgi:hypothetical protein